MLRYYNNFPIRVNEKSAALENNLCFYFEVVDFLHNKLLAIISFPLID